MIQCPCLFRPVMIARRAIIFLPFLLLLLSCPLLSLSEEGSGGGSGSGSGNSEGGTAAAAAATTTTTKTTTTTASQAQPPKKTKGVIELTSKNFDSSIRDGNVWLIEFYAPWCGHCNRFAPTYESVAHKLHAMHDINQEEDGHADGGGGKKMRNIMVAKVDGARERAISSRFGVRGFPSFFLVEGWTVRQYEGSRTMDALINFATKSYEKVEPMPFLHSPFGPLGQFRALLMWSGTKVIDLFDWLVSKGLSHTIAGLLICSVGIICGLFSIIFIGMMTLPKPKED